MSLFIVPPVLKEAERTNAYVLVGFSSTGFELNWTNTLPIAGGNEIGGDLYVLSFLCVCCFVSCGRFGHRRVVRCVFLTEHKTVPAQSLVDLSTSVGTKGECSLVGEC